jgi:hypothetical protein
MIPVYIDLRNYIGEQVKIRYRFGTDDNTPGDGWYLDDVEIMDAVLYNSTACMSSDQSDVLCAQADERGTIVDTQITISTDGNTSPVAFAIMPNPAGDFIQVAMSSAHTEKAEVYLYTMTGHMMSAAAWSLTEGVNQKTLDISGFAPGMYVMQVKTGSGMKSEKFVKN